MDQAVLSSSSVLEALLKTNRPPTDQEKAIIQESMAPTNAKLKGVEAQISDTMAHIQALKSQIEDAEIKLERLREEEAAILETFADHRRVFSPFRNLPEDVLREICIACVKDQMPTLTYPITPLPYKLTQISSEMRHIALATPFIWASMCITYETFHHRDRLDARAYSILASRASAWFERARGMALTIFIQDPTSSYARLNDGESDPSSILFDTIFSYSARWKVIEFDSICRILSPPIIRFAALTAADVPVLQSVSLCLDCSIPDSVLSNTVFLKIPTLKHVLLETNDVQRFTVNWAVLTSVTLRAKWDTYGHSKDEIAAIFQQTKCLVYCDIVVGPVGSESHYPSKIDLPFLETLHIRERYFGSASSGVPSLLDFITAPALAIFSMPAGFLEPSLSGFIQQSPRIRNLSLPYLQRDKSFTLMTGILRHCPSLTVLSVGPCWWNEDPPPPKYDANMFLRGFVEEGGVGVTCPGLQCIRFTGELDFSVQTLRLFLEGKQGDITTPSISPWKRVDIGLSGIKATETRKQTLDLISQKKAEGLNVDAILE